MGPLSNLYFSFLHTVPLKQILYVHLQSLFSTCRFQRGF